MTTRCSAVSLELAEPLAGTAVLASALVLVEQPGRWGRLGAEDSPHPAHPEVLADLAARAGRAGVRVQLLRRPVDRRPAGAEAPWHPTVVLAVTDATGGRAVRAEVTPEDLAALELDALAAGHLPHEGWEPVRSLWAVCTHGRRDVCCAQHGRRLASALAAQLGNGPQDAGHVSGAVWETSHLGGHRFAPTVLHLPDGLVYGRVPLARVGELVAAHADGRCVPDLLRGRSALEPALQVAEVTLRRHLGVDDDALALVATESGIAPRDGESRTSSTWTCGGRTWRVVVDAAAASPRPVSCGAGVTRPLAHTVVELTDVEAPGRGADAWDRAHATERAPSGPDPDVLEAVRGRVPGRALDLACGRGRHTLMLARAGWDVTAVDFSRTAIDAVAGQARGLAVRTELADARLWEPPDGAGFDLVLLSFVQLPGVLARAAGWLRPGGRLVLVGPAGAGGPADHRLRHDARALAEEAGTAGLQLVRAEEVSRHRHGGRALDVVLVADRPGRPRAR